MKLAIFAADDVGVEVVKFLAENEEPVSCLVLDSHDAKNQNDRILEFAAADTILLSEDLEKPETLQLLETFDLDLIILAWWPYLIKPPLINIPRLGCLNFHPSYLPFNRGKHPNFWAIVDGTPFGVTIHFIDEGIDSGDIVFQKQIEISWTDNGETLYQKAKEGIIRLFEERLPDIKAGRLSRKEQCLNSGSLHYAKELEPRSVIHLDERYRARDLLNLIRARTFAPHPGVRFTDQGKTFQVRLEITEVSAGGVSENQ